MYGLPKDISSLGQKIKTGAPPLTASEPHCIFLVTCSRRVVWTAESDNPSAAAAVVNGSSHVISATNPSVMK